MVLPPVYPRDELQPVTVKTELLRTVDSDKMAPEAIAYLTCGKAHISMFDFTPPEKRSVPPRISVWAHCLTTCQQAWILTGSSPTTKWILRLDIDKVRKIRPEGFDEGKALEVVWEAAGTPHGPETKPGYRGHAGIQNIQQGGDNKTGKRIRKSIRAQLADLSPPHLLSETEKQQLTWVQLLLCFLQEVFYCIAARPRPKSSNSVAPICDD